MVLQHPVCQVISLIGAIACFCCLGGEKPGGFRLWYALALFVLTAAVNPAFSHEGRTILRYLPSGNPLTLESVLYGLGARAHALHGFNLVFRLHAGHDFR